MSFETEQALRYMFNGYTLVFTVLICVYGLIIDLKRFDEDGLKRERKLAKRMYISCIIVGIIAFTIPRVF